MDKSALDKEGPAKDHGYCNQPHVYRCHGPEPLCVRCGRAEVWRQAVKQRRRETAQYWNELIEALGDFTLAESPEMYASKNRPECPRCETNCQEVVYGFPVTPPAKGEEGKFHYAGCITNFWPRERERWWCPGCNVFIGGSALTP